MANIVADFTTFIKSLNFIDIMFVLSILGLVILIVILIYIIKINDDESDEKIVQEEEKVEEDLDLMQITKEIDEKAIKPLSLNDYEKEQEEKAIISYDELLKTKDLQEDINYIKEQNLGDLTVKSVDVESITKPIELPKIKEKLAKMNKKKEEVEMSEEPKPVLISYEKEEEFLRTLKVLEQSLN